MPDRIIHKRSLTAGSVPATSSLEIGELAINVADGKVHLRRSGSANNDVVSLVTANTITTGSIQATAGFTGSLFGTASNATVAVTASSADSFLVRNGIIVSGTYVQDAGANSSPWVLNAYSTDSSYFAGVINAINGMAGFRVDTNGQSQYIARTSTHTDRELRYQLYSDGNCYFGMQGLSGTIVSDLIIRTSADSGVNNGAIKFVLMGSQKMAITPSGIQITNSVLNIDGNVSITGSLDVSGGITGSLQGTASNAISSSYADVAQSAPLYVLSSITSSMLDPYVLTSVTSSMTVLSSSFATTASYISPTFISASAAASGFGSGGGGTGTGFPFTGSAQITGSLVVTGSVSATSFTGDGSGLTNLPTAATSNLFNYYNFI